MKNEDSTIKTILSQEAEDLAKSSTIRMSNSSIKYQEPKRILISADQIQNKIKELAATIDRDCAGKELTLICILKGSVLFASDLARALKTPTRFEFMSVASYHGGTTSSGEVKMILDLREPIENRHVLVVEDIVDSGLTLNYLIENLRLRKPATLKCAALLVKPESIKSPVMIDYRGFEIGNEFVVGYGMDYKELYRNLPYVGVLES